MRIRDRYGVKLYKPLRSNISRLIGEDGPRMRFTASAAAAVGDAGTECAHRHLGLPLCDDSA